MDPWIVIHSEGFLHMDWAGRLRGKATWLRSQRIIAVEGCWGVQLNRNEMHCPSMWRLARRAAAESQRLLLLLFFVEAGCDISKMARRCDEEWRITSRSRVNWRREFLLRKSGEESTFGQGRTGRWRISGRAVPWPRPPLTCHEPTQSRAYHWSVCLQGPARRCGTTERTNEGKKR